MSKCPSCKRKEKLEFPKGKRKLKFYLSFIKNCLSFVREASEIRHACNLQSICILLQSIIQELQQFSTSELDMAVVNTDIPTLYRYRLVKLGWVKELKFRFMKPLIVESFSLGY